jgi:serine/threonine-protein kinase RsbW
MTTATLKFEATFEANTVNLAKIRTFIREAARGSGADDSTLDEIELAVDEACTNVIEHGYQGQVEGRTIRIEVTSSRRAIVITIIDRSAEFDPSSVPLPDLEQVRRDLQVGGLGLFLVRTLMDDVSYEAGPEGNRLTLTKRVGL